MDVQQSPELPANLFQRAHVYEPEALIQMETHIAPFRNPRYQRVELQSTCLIHDCFLQSSSGTPPAILTLDIE